MGLAGFSRTDAGQQAPGHEAPGNPGGAMLTLEKHLNLMKHALGKTPDSRHLLIDTFNRAGNALYTYHRWSWRSKGPTTLAIPASSEQVQLPKDFGELISISSTNTNVFRVHPTTVADIMLMRGTQTYDSLALFIAFRVSGSPGTLTSPINEYPIAEIFPTQATARTDVKLHYLSRWVDMDETQDPQAVPPVPAEWEQALVLMARKYAVELENQEQAFEERALETELSRLVMYDGGRQVNLGRPMHSVRGYYQGTAYPHSRVGPKT